MSKIQSITIRYFLLIIISLGNFWIIYKTFTFPTITLSYFFIHLIYPLSLLEGNTIQYSSKLLAIIAPCVAGAAYFLLLLLNLGTSMPLKTRIKSLVFLILTFFLINILRIVLFAVLFARNYLYLDLLHSITWHFLSIFIVIILWFINIRLFNIKQIPFYSDLKYLYSLINNKK